MSGESRLLDPHIGCHSRCMGDYHTKWHKGRVASRRPVVFNLAALLFFALCLDIGLAQCSRQSATKRYFDNDAALLSSGHCLIGYLLIGNGAGSSHDPAECIYTSGKEKTNTTNSDTFDQTGSSGCALSPVGAGSLQKYHDRMDLLSFYVWCPPCPCGQWAIYS